MTKEKKPTTATTSKTKQPVGRPKKSPATTPPLPKGVEKLAAAKKAAKPIAKNVGTDFATAVKGTEKLATGTRSVGVALTKPAAKKQSEKSQAARDLTKAVKGTHARPSTTPALYDAKAAFELSQSQINKLNRKLISQGKTIETLTKVISDQGHEIRRTKKLVGTLVETHNADVNQRIDKAIDSRKPWYKRLSNRRSS